jgi:hypothetical protein
MWRTAAPQQRAQGAVLGLLAAWLTFWGWVESASGFAFDGIDDWHWDNEIVDLVRWVGWIPVALWLYRRIDAGTRAPPAPAAPAETPRRRPG